jgi:hypothetical protein
MTFLAPLPDDGAWITKLSPYRVAKVSRNERQRKQPSQKEEAFGLGP